jgi:site-specific recombinase XerD
LLPARLKILLKANERAKSEVWFCHTPLGKNSIGNIAKKMTEQAGIHEKKTNHSGRKTAIQTLLHAAVPPTAVMQLSGHKNVRPLNSYAHLSHEQQRTMSRILSGKSKQTSACDF